MRNNITLITGLIVLISSCHMPELNQCDNSIPDDLPVMLDHEQTYLVDSTCLLIPNVFTPNGDGYNDYFYPVTKNVDSLHIIIRDMDGLILFSNASTYWDGIIGATAQRGFYQYEIFIRSASGVSRVLTGKVFASIDTFNDCFKNGVSPKLGDMIDPNLCSFYYNSAEIFCMQ